MLFGGRPLVDEDLLRAYVFYGALLVLKMLAMAPLTARFRIKKKVFANPEDAAVHKVKVVTDDEDVERVRRAHLNDMENVYLFFAAAAFYLTTDPEPRLALNLIRAFTASRYLHTVFYLNQTRQPTRGIAFIVGALIMTYMCVSTIKFYF